MALVISDEMVRNMGLTDQELRLEIAAALYRRAAMTLMQAATFAGLDRLEFGQALMERGIPQNYSAEDVEQDVQTLRELGRL